MQIDNPRNEIIQDDIIAKTLDFTVTTYYETSLQDHKEIYNLCHYSVESEDEELSSSDESESDEEDELDEELSDEESDEVLSDSEDDCFRFLAFCSYKIK